MAKPMFDILERQIHEGDIVVVKGNGGRNTTAKAMEVGVRIGDTIKTLTSSRDPGDKFLVVNPSEKEIMIKNQIISQIYLKKAKSRANAAERSKQKADKVGTIYQMTRNEEILLYLGKATIESSKDGVVDVVREGKVYVSLGYHGRNISKFEKMTTKELVEHLKHVTGISAWRVGEIGSCFEFAKSTKIYNKIIGEVVDLEKDFLVSFDCQCLINRVKPYESGEYKIKVG